ncbi:MAG: xanthine dehydrogenase family protein molybdopterin-binding subunit [Acidobacteria bacterium]|nr:xanthine dehydrogenase family protein molybdopterin-binding subunit [Acidobacteriota bacterium]
MNAIDPNLDHDMEVPDGWGFIPTFDRRDFIKLTTTGLLVMFNLRPAAASPAAQGRGGAAATDLNAFLHIGADGRVTCLVGKIEMGQGIMTSLPQMAADELDVPLSQVDIVMGDTDLCPFDNGTFGSLSTRQFGPVLRRAAAEAKAVLIEMAAERWHVPASELKVDAGTVVHRSDPTKRIGYGQLTEGRRIERKVSVQPTLEPPSAFEIVGKTTLRRDGLDKVTGKAKYAGDIVPPGALHARIVRPPAHGATLQSVDTSAAERVPGVRVVRDGNMVAVLHAHRDEADKALRLVKATFSPSPSTVTDQTIFEHIVKAAPAGNVTASSGDLAAGRTLATQVFDETYRKGYVAHAPMEPHAAVAAVENGKITVWASTQTPFPLKSQIASALDVAPDKVRVITPYVGGGFGGKSAGQQAIEAARLAVAAGVPVRVMWSREEEFFFDTFDPATVLTIRSGFDANHRITFWDYTVIGAGSRGAEHLYDVPHHRTLVRGGWQGATPGMNPFAVGPWRAPGANANAFGRESQIDVMAAKAGKDPVEFRLRNLTDERARGVLHAAAQAFGWTPKAAPSGRGVGVAIGADAGAYVANMAEVEVDRTTGRVQVVRVVCAQDNGITINPDGLEQQIVGGMMQGLGYVLTEEVHFKNGDVTDRNFGTYQLPRFSWMPKLQAVIVKSDLPAQGGGEPSVVPMGAVIANAVFDAIGVRMRQLPMTPARVLEALKGSAT